jgi:hypothetical protein
MVNIGYASKFNPEVVTMMNISFNKLHWPLLTFFIWKEKITKLDFDGVTNKDFREADFSSTHIKFYLKMVMICKTPLIQVEDSLYARAKHNLTPHGKKIAEIMWNTLNYYMKQYTGKTVEDEAKKLKETLSIEVDKEDIDEEEQFLKELEDDNRKAEEADKARNKKRAEEARDRRAKEKAGIVEGPNGPIINLDMVKVK